MNTDLETLSRLQFAITAAFHMTFPAVTVGLSLFLVAMYAAYLRTNHPIYLSIYRFWKKIFAVGFGLGVVAGVVMTFEFGLNWGRYANAVGPILGVIIGMEVVTAFFLEAGFLGIMLYGDGRVGRRAMFFATMMVALGSFLSTTWILAANSWMHTPVGYTMVNGQFQPTSWWQAIFNPAFRWRYPHMLGGVLISATFFVTSTGAWYLLQRRHLAFARRTFSLGLGLLSIFLPIQLFIGDSLAGIMLAHQPPKLLAVEGNWDSTNTGYNLLIIPDQANQRNLVQVSLPCLGSIILGHDFGCRTPVPGLASTPVAQQPPMVFTFYGFRVMFYGSILMFIVMLIGVVQRLRGTLYTARWFHWLTLIMLPSGVLAIIGGWVTSETGRQPYVVYGLLRTADALSPLSPAVVLASLVLFISTYTILLGLYIAYVIRLIRQGPEDPAIEPPTRGTPAPRRAPLAQPGDALAS